MGEHLFCVAIVCGVKCLCYLFVYRTIPLWSITQVGLPRAAVLGMIITISLILKELQVSITDSGVESLPEYSVFFILLQAALLLCLLLFEQYQQKARENTAYRLQQVTVLALMKNIRVRQEKDEAIRSLRHDLKNHMLTLRHLVGSDCKAQAMKYIDDFLGQADLSELRLQTGSPLLDGLIGEKLSAAVQNGIAVNVVTDFQKGELLDNFDLCVIFGNALDNAIESCLKAPEGQRFIDIKGGPVTGNLLLRIANSTAEPVSTAGGLPLSTKRDREQHGFGLKNIQRALEKYHGTLDAHMEGEQFVLSILIPLPEK